ncbi:DUF6281 family protein [Nocardioides iriomotensis]|uniref:DUF3558 domain-containing protein n=1 Tax=Nocardioides iriomotensis TaxID=715784 RepID=A0A4Q5J8Y6_9ACTN|nr:DUF6281 family protein [Nocardioides iriomotensis]RYU14349.1 hypothetical protein ETU37_03870 [Nocardioides iriomotensis]
MLRTSVPVAAMLAFLLTGCAGDTTSSEPSAAYECTPEIRFDGVVYSAYDYTDQGATKFGTADEADCHDVGREAPGSVFPNDPRQVAVWTFGGYTSEQVLGVRFGPDSFMVFIADSVPRDQAEHISRTLRKGALRAVRSSADPVNGVPAR